MAINLGEQALLSAGQYNTWAAEHVFESAGLPAQFLVDYHMPLGDAQACWPPEDSNFARATANFQADHQEFGLMIDGCLGTRTLGAIGAVYPEETGEPAPILLTSEEKSKLVQFTVKFEGGSGENPYNGQNKDAEYEGWFDQPKTKNGKRLKPSDRAKEPNHAPHRASRYHPSGGFHIGLSWGAWQAAQEPGALGSLLATCQALHPTLFKEVFGPASGELVITTTSRNRRTGKFSSRTKQVGGAYLWEQPWLDRFTKAASCEEFREAQRQWVSDQYLDKILTVAADHNMDSAGDLAVLFDICIQFGFGGLKKYVQRSGLVAGSPFDTSKIRKVIGALPKSHHKRRNHILDEADQSVRYTW